MPRHPPCALTNLTTKMKMLASTIQFSNNDQTPNPEPPPTPQTWLVWRRPAPAKKPRHHNTPTPASTNETPVGVRAARFLRTQQCALIPTHQHPDHTGPACQREYRLVDVPPMSKTTHRTLAGSVVNHHPRPSEPGQCAECSLERR